MAATLTTLASFSGPNGAYPQDGLTTDAQGDLYGTTAGGGGSGTAGTVFEIVHNADGSYASNPVTLASFNISNGNFPGVNGALIADAQGNLIGTTVYGGGGYGTVYEIVHNADGSYVSSPVTLVSFNGSNGARPFAGLIADAQGNLFGTTQTGGGADDGTVFEIVHNADGSYANGPVTLAGFSLSNGANPTSRLIADAKGNLFGTTQSGGSGGAGTVFEIVHNADGSYASGPVTLASFNGSNGASPSTGLIADAQGNLFSTTYQGGGGYGTVFEIVHNADGSYASSPLTLANFNGSNGANPYAGLIADAQGNLFGTTVLGGGYGTVFEIVHNADGSYASSPLTVANFNNSNGADPYAGLTTDAQGNLFGTTVNGGSGGAGTVFEITNSGFVVTQVPAAPGVSLAIDSGVPADKITNSGFVDVTGLAAGATWEYSVNGGAYVAGIGTSFTVSGDGAKMLLVRQSVGAGNTSTSTPFDFTLKTTTSESAIADAAVTTGSDGKNYINAARFNGGATTLAGTAEAGDTVTVSDGTHTTTATVAANGTWTAAITGLVNGQSYSYVATATDIAGNTAASAPFGFTVDTVAPIDSISTNGGSVFNPIETITGKGETGTKVQLFDGANTLGSAVGVDANGNWSEQVTLVGTGNHAITAQDTDAAGNVGTTVAVNFALANQIVTPAGQTSVAGTSGSDHITIGSGNIFVSAGAGDDTITLTPGSAPQFHFIDGGSGSNSLDLSLTTGAVTVNLGGGYAYGNEIGFSGLASIQNIVAGSGMDTLIGSRGANVIQAGTGNDMMTGGGGGDTFVFKPNFGNDVITDFHVASSRTSPNDVIQFDHSVFADWTALQGSISNSAHGAEITVNPHETITLNGVTMAQLVANHLTDFHFV